MTNPYPTLGRDIATEATPPQTNYDPGQGDIGDTGEYAGMPVINPNQLHGEPVPETFEQQNPEYSYTNAPPAHRPTPVYEAAARTGIVRSFILASTGDPTMILTRNPRRRKALISTNSVNVSIADDPAALQGMGAGNYGQGFPVPPIPFYWESQSELYGMLTTGANVAIGIIEYIDN